MDNGKLKIENEASLDEEPIEDIANKTDVNLSISSNTSTTKLNPNPSSLNPNSSTLIPTTYQPKTTENYGDCLLYTSRCV